MKVYSDTLTTRDLYEALPRGVTLAVCEGHPRPRKRRNGWTVSLSGTSPYRSQVSASGHQAATWDEHGVWMAALYRRDPEAVIGHYKTRGDFVAQTLAERERVRRWFDRDSGIKSVRVYARTHRAPWLTPGGELAAA